MSRCHSHTQAAAKTVELTNPGMYPPEAIPRNQASIPG